MVIGDAQPIDTNANARKHVPKLREASRTNPFILFSQLSWLLTLFDIIHNDVCLIRMWRPSDLGRASSRQSSGVGD